MHETSKSLSKHIPVSQTTLPTLTKRILRRINFCLVGVTQKDETAFILRFAGCTVTGRQECLVEVTLPHAAAEVGRISVHTEAISLGLQLANEVTACLSA